VKWNINMMTEDGQCLVTTHEYVPATSNTHRTKKGFLEAVYSMQSVPRMYNDNTSEVDSHLSVESRQLEQWVSCEMVAGRQCLSRIVSFVGTVTEQRLVKTIIDEASVFCSDVKCED
jgi:hypothetical protein